VAIRNLRLCQRQTSVDLIVGIPKKEEKDSQPWLIDTWILRVLDSQGLRFIIALLD
jgi:hypothetical protein